MKNFLFALFVTAFVTILGAAAAKSTPPHGLPVPEQGA